MNSSELQTRYREKLEKLMPRIADVVLPLPEQQIAPEERALRRLAWRNERSLYHGTCSLSGKRMITMYAPDLDLRIAEHEAWWGDGWDPGSFGRPVDFRRPFFEQFDELFREVPHLALVNSASENSIYNNWVIHLKNCYLLTGSRWDEDCLYSHWLWSSRDCADCAFVYDSELCYECVDCANCYSTSFSQECENCRDSMFLRDCRGCADCICCAGLEHERFYWLNERLSEQAYRQRLAAIQPLTRQTLSDLERAADALAVKQNARRSKNLLCEECGGTYLAECKDCHGCYDAQKSRDCLFCESIMQSNDLLDCSRSTLSNVCYECLSAVNSTNVYFSIMCWYCSDVLYSDSCHNSKNLFGCSGIKRGEYCVLNRSYTKAEYEALVRKLYEHMKETGEWGQFFPAHLSPFGYNETAASCYVPRLPSEAQTLGYRWRSNEAMDSESGAAGSSVCECASSGRRFRLTAAEKEFYRRQIMPTPLIHPDQRHFNRLARRVPFSLAGGERRPYPV